MRRILLMSVSAIAFGMGAALAAEPAPVGPEDQVLGPADAPVTVIEYASLTCPHCARWEADIFPQVKKEWIDTNKIRFVFRDFPLDGSALKAAQLAHCTGDARFWGFLQLEFASQGNWARQGDPTNALAQLVRLGGVSDEKARACMSDDSKLARAVTESRAEGEKAGVDSTPTFFFNGKKVSGEILYDEFVKDLHDAGVAS